MAKLFCKVESLYNIKINHLAQNIKHSQFMIILRTSSLPNETITVPISPLNTVWVGKCHQTIQLPQLGHLCLIFPLTQSNILVADTVLKSDHYLWLTPSGTESPILLKNLAVDDSAAEVLVVMLSPGFVADMAEFLDIPADMNQLLHGIALPKGDMVSNLLEMLADTMPNYASVYELFMEIVGLVLNLLRLHSAALLRLTDHKQTTITDLTTRLLQARQFIEASYLQPIQTADVANHVALSKYHFARLFKRIFGLTVHQYVISLRLNNARHLIESTELNITDISLETGYNSLSVFINAFRRKFSLTPSNYRARFQIKK